MESVSHLMTFKFIDKIEEDKHERNAFLVAGLGFVILSAKRAYNLHWKTYGKMTITLWDWWYTIFRQSHVFETSKLSCLPFCRCRSTARCGESGWHFSRKICQLGWPIGFRQLHRQGIEPTNVMRFINKNGEISYKHGAFLIYWENQCGLSEQVGWLLQPLNATLGLPMI